MPWASGPTDDDPRDIRIAFGRGIRALRLYQGWSQRYLGARCQLDQSIISRLETGRPVSIRFSRVLAVLEAMGVDRAVFKSRWEGDTYMAFLHRWDPDTLGPEMPEFPWRPLEPPRDPWNQPWIDERDDDE